MANLAVFYPIHYMKKKHIARLSVSHYTSKGHGLAYHNTTPVEIKNTIPGDEVTVQLLRNKKKIKQSWIEEFHTYSKSRIPPKCGHFPSCGGCRWQQIPYEEQLSIKEETLLKLFTPTPSQWLGLIPCKDPWYYRNKMEFTFSQNKAGEKFLGLANPCPFEV